MKSLAFIGLGAMGSAMAERLLAAGYSLTVFDTVEAAMQPLLRRGARRASTPAEAAEGKDMAFACLPSPDISRKVALEAGGICGVRSLGAYVEMSTIGSETMFAIASDLAERGIGVLDAPVSGGPRGARAGTLTAIIAGPTALLHQCDGPLRAIAGNVIHVGERPGLAQVAKLANNMISAAAMAASFEAVVMGVKAGLDADSLVELINVSTGRCGATLDKFPQSILPRTFDYGGRLEVMYKDVMLCLEEFRARSVPHHASSSVAQLWFQGMAEGRARDDYTSLIKVIENWAGVEVRGKAAEMARERREV